jgi:hypothetical protein
LPTARGEPRWPWWKIKGWQTCLCDHVSVTLGTLANASCSNARQRLRSQLDEGGISAYVLPLSNIDGNNDPLGAGFCQALAQCADADYHRTDWL